MKNESPDKKWTEQLSKLKVKFPFLQDEDFHYDYGRKEEMLTALQNRLNKDRVALNELLDALW